MQKLVTTLRRPLLVNCVVVLSFVHESNHTMSMPQIGLIETGTLLIKFGVPTPWPLEKSLTLGLIKLTDGTALIKSDPSGWAVSPHDYEQDTFVIWLMSKYPGAFGRFSSKVTPRFVAVSPHRISDEELAELSRL